MANIIKEILTGVLDLSITLHLACVVWKSDEESLDDMRYVALLRRKAIDGGGLAEIAKRLGDIAKVAADAAQQPEMQLGMAVDLARAANASAAIEDCCTMAHKAIKGTLHSELERCLTQLNQARTDVAEATDRILASSDLL